MDKLINKYVVVRSAQSGVWFGRLVAGAGDTLELSDARKVWSWIGANATSGLATKGPSGGRICSAVETAVVSGCCEVLLVTAQAAERFAAVAPW